MKTNEAKGKANKILTNNGYTINDGIVSFYESISFEKSMKVRNLLSDIIFTNNDGNECTYQLLSAPNKVDLKLVEVEL